MICYMWNQAIPDWEKRDLEPKQVYDLEIRGAIIWTEYAFKKIRGTHPINCRDIMEAWPMAESHLCGIKGGSWKMGLEE